MTITEHLKRARGLIAAGRFQRKALKSLEALEPIDAQASTVEGRLYDPYYDASLKQVTFVRAANGGVAYEQLIFSQFDYRYGAQDGIVWVDKDEE